MSATVEIVVGVIGRAHGIRGQVSIDVRTDEPQLRFAVGTVLRGERDRQSFTVTSARDHSGRLLLTFGELADRTAAESVRGTRLVLDVAEDAVSEEEGTYYDRQLVGLSVLDHTGASVGTVTAVVHLPAQDTLEVRTNDGTRLIPFVFALVPVVDLAAGTVQLSDVSGLLVDEED